MTAAHDGSPRRQARGKRRIEQILDAAAELFAAEGFDAATTNAIAARAGISPGSLYQYFANKDAIATALTERFAQRLWPARTTDEVTDLATMPLADAVDRLVDPLIAFYQAHPGFLALATGANQSPRLADITREFHQGVVDRAAAIVAVRLAHVTPARRQRLARVCVQIVWSLLSLISAADPDERAALTGELKTVIVRYLTPIWDGSDQADEPSISP